jgi:hypothetical protein
VFVVASQLGNTHHSVSPFLQLIRIILNVELTIEEKIDNVLM